MASKLCLDDANFFSALMASKLYQIVLITVIVSKLYLDYVDFSLSLVARKLYQIYRFLFGGGNQQ